MNFQLNCMENPFEIKFIFPMKDSSIAIWIEAEVMLHHSPPYYKVHKFHFAGKPENSAIITLPEMDILHIKKNGISSWIEKDSETETPLSIAIGTAISNAIKEKMQESG